jgi:hypothetical protein
MFFKKLKLISLWKECLAMRSSLGFHTLSLSMPLTFDGMNELICDFKKYSKETGEIKMFLLDQKGNRIEYKNINRATPLKLIIQYYKDNHGIEWSVDSYTDYTGFSAYKVNVKINPKILGGVHDYITAATYDDMGAAIENFNLESEKISYVLRTFDCYRLDRIDYCINFSVDELAPGCSPEQIMALIRRGDIPRYYKEWQEYSNISHRKKSSPDSFYLVNKSLGINCYRKLAEMEKRSEQREQNGLSVISQSVLDTAKNIIRFEVQEKYRKTYVQSRKAEDSGNLGQNKYESLLDDLSCNNAVSYYFHKIIGKGDWYTLNEAIRIIQSRKFNKQKEIRLISALRIVNHYHSVAKAKEAFEGDGLEDFRKSLKDLSCMGINPVTIPKGWGMKHIPNILYAYFDKKNEENMNKIEIDEKIVKEYLKEMIKTPSKINSPRLFNF